MGANAVKRYALTLDCLPGIYHRAICDRVHLQGQSHMFDNNALFSPTKLLNPYQTASAGLEPLRCTDLLTDICLHAILAGTS